jgi:hypothetical protein
MITCYRGFYFKVSKSLNCPESSGISFDQSDHIRNNILHDYFTYVPPSSILKQPYPFPLDSSFEQRLFEALLGTLLVASCTLN